MIVAHHGTGNDRLLPAIVQTHLRGGDVELAVQARQQRLEPPALFFERGAGGEVQVDGEDGKHFCSPEIKISALVRESPQGFHGMSRDFNPAC